MGDIGNRGGCVSVGAGGIREISVPSQFVCEPKTALNKVFKKKLKEHIYYLDYINYLDYMYSLDNLNSRLSTGSHITILITVKKNLFKQTLNDLDL